MFICIFKTCKLCFKTQVSLSLFQHNLEVEIKWYYIVELAFYVSLLSSVLIDNKRKVSMFYFCKLQTVMYPFWKYGSTKQFFVSMSNSTIAEHSYKAIQQGT